jgi:hypothetical protein
MRRVQDAEGRDAGPCPDCHPLSTGRTAS